MPSHFINAMNKLCYPIAIVLTTTKDMTFPNGIFFFFKKGLHILHMNVNSLLPKIDEIRFITKQSNVSILELLNPNSFILNSEVNIVGYDTIRMNH